MRLDVQPVSDAPLPSRFWVGIGCQRGTGKAVIGQAVRTVFQAYGLVEDAIAGIATIDTKVNEAGLIAFCRDQDLPLLFFEADVLRSVAVPNASGAIKAAVGTPSVAEAAAMLAYWEMEGVGSLATAETHRCGETTSMVLPKPDLYVPKQRFHGEGCPGSVTIAVVQSTQATHITARARS